MVKIETIAMKLCSGIVKPVYCDRPKVKVDFVDPNQDRLTSLVYFKMNH